MMPSNTTTEVKSRMKPELRVVPAAQVQSLSVEGVLRDVRCAFYGLCVNAGKRAGGHNGSWTRGPARRWRRSFQCAFRGCGCPSRSLPSPDPSARRMTPAHP